MEQLYRCSYCKKFIGTKEEVTGHEKFCDFNPKLKTCFSCYYYNSTYSVCENAENDKVYVDLYKAHQENECHVPKN